MDQKHLTHMVRVDFGGGWLDVPRFARECLYCKLRGVSPTVSLQDWQYEKRSGLGGSGAWALSNGKSVHSELNLGVSWQDPAIITDKTLCLEERSASGSRPKTRRHPPPG